MRGRSTIRVTVFERLHLKLVHIQSTKYHIWKAREKQMTSHCQQAQRLGRAVSKYGTWEILNLDKL